MTYMGARVRRVEDPRFVKGQGQYVGDLKFPGMVQAGFVRSPYAHARILSVDVSRVLDLPGIVAAHTASDLPEVSKPVEVQQNPPGLKGHGYPPLASDTVRHVGEPIAVVLAEDPYALADALEVVDVDYEPLHAVIDVEAATEAETRVWEDVPRNLAVDTTFGFGNVYAAFEAADVVVQERFSFARAAGASMETRGVAAVPGGEDGVRVTLWDSTQSSSNVRHGVAGYLDLHPDEVRVIAADVGGGFGPKGRLYPEELVVAALALRHHRPVRYQATRTEDLLTTAHGRGQIHYAQVAARADGTILALRDRLIQDVGAYTPSGLQSPLNTVRHVLGPYRVPAASVHVQGVYTNKVMISPLRGGGRPEGIFVMERLLDRLAERLSIDRAEIRRRNFIPPDAFPYETGMMTGHGRAAIYDSGNFPKYLETALQKAGYADFRQRQQEARREGRYLGLGLVAFIESTGVGEEEARVEVQEDGTVTVSLGSPSQGQGHETTFAQVAADRLGVSLESISVSSGDTGTNLAGIGTFASRMGVYGGNAVSLAAGAVREMALQLAADMLEIAPQDLEVLDGRITVKGLPERNVSLAEVAQEAIRQEVPLQANRTFQPPHQSAWAGGVNVAIVEVDAETGAVTIQRYLVVHDAGTLINPTVVEGQIHGGVAHGVGNALLEQCVYDESGQLVTATFMDYAMPHTVDAPEVEIVHFETPSPFNPEGIKGAGEGGTIAAIPTIVSAVEDALVPFDIKLSDVPISAQDIALAVRQARNS